jgi:hypothetical protein
MMLPVLSALLAFAVGLFRSLVSLCLARLALRHQLRDDDRDFTNNVTISCTPVWTEAGSPC